jgi:hypothetical protein
MAEHLMITSRADVKLATSRICHGRIPSGRGGKRFAQDKYLMIIAGKWKPR